MREKKYQNKLKIVRKVSYAVLEKRCGKIKIEIDILTPCLKRIRDGKVANTYFVEGLPLKKELDNLINVIIATNPQTTCNENENHAFLGNNPIAIKIAANKFNIWYVFPLSILFKDNKPYGTNTKIIPNHPITSYIIN